MGTRIHVFLDHDLGDLADAAVLTRLEPTLPATLAVRDYWFSVGEKGDSSDRWTARPCDYDVEGIPTRRFWGPGSLFLNLTPRAALIYTGGRWRGFLTIEPLRRVHLAAFRAIAQAIGSSRMAICHDSSPATYDVFDAGESQERCIERLLASYGPPQPSPEYISRQVAAEAERTVPNVWYLEELPAPLR